MCPTALLVPPPVFGRVAPVSSVVIHNRDPLAYLAGRRKCQGTAPLLPQQRGRLDPMNRERTARHRPRAAASRGNFRPTLAWRHDSTPPAWAGLSKGTAPLRKGRSRVFHQGVDITPAPSNATRLPHCAGVERGDRAALGSFLHGYRSPKLPLRCSARAHNLAIRHSVRPRLISPVHLF